MVDKIKDIIKKTRPALSLIYGDTNSSLAGAVASYLSGILIAHIEAGERSFDFEMPEERNRILIDHYSQFLFCATRTAVNHLKKEGVKGRVFFAGNVMYDSVLSCLPKVKSATILNKLKLEPKKYHLLTLHRPQNVDSKDNILALLEIFTKHNQQVVFPLHPRTKKRLQYYGLLSKFKKAIKIIPPQPYLNLLALLYNSTLVMTDSGGLQTEAFSLGIPCITFLNQTTWVETVASGNNRVVGLDRKKIESALNYFSKHGFNKAPDIFGNGQAYLNIVNQVENYFL